MKIAFLDEAKLLTFLLCTGDEKRKKRHKSKHHKHGKSKKEKRSQREDEDAPDQDQELPPSELEPHFSP